MTAPGTRAGLGVLARGPQGDTCQSPRWDGVLWLSGPHGGTARI